MCQPGIWDPLTSVGRPFAVGAPQQVCDTGMEDAGPKPRKKKKRKKRKNPEVDAPEEQVGTPAEQAAGQAADVRDRCGSKKRRRRTQETSQAHAAEEPGGHVDVDGALVLQDVRDGLTTAAQVTPTDGISHEHEKAGQSEPVHDDVETWKSEKDRRRKVAQGSVSCAASAAWSSGAQSPGVHVLQPYCAECSPVGRWPGCCFVQRAGLPLVSHLVDTMPRYCVVV